MPQGRRVIFGSVSLVSLASLASLAFVVACDTEPSSKPSQAAASASAASPPPPPKPPPPPTAPQIVVEDAQCMLDGEPFLFNAPDPAGRIAAALKGKPFVEGADVTVSASRDAKVPRIAAVVQALKAAKAKSAVIKSQKRDSSMGELDLAIEHPPIADCTVTGMINKDGSIAVWSAGGGGAKRFSRGFAGPDLTLGSQAIQKASAACDSQVWLVAADDSLPWGLAYDLALTATGAGEGGAMRATKTVLLGAAPVAGRKVTE